MAPTRIPVADPGRALSRMLLHAIELLEGSTIIEAERDPASAPAYLLKLTGLEILLKAGALHEDGKAVPTGHDMAALYELQSPALKQRVEAEFADRELALADDVGAPLPDLLTVLSLNFIRFRYTYEVEFPYNAEGRADREQRFIEGTLPVGEWDVVYHLQLVDILLSELLEELKAHRQGRFEPLRWEKSRLNGSNDEMPT